MDDDFMDKLDVCMGERFVAELSKTKGLEEEEANEIRRNLIKCSQARQQHEVLAEKLQELSRAIVSGSMETLKRLLKATEGVAGEDLWLKGKDRLEQMKTTYAKNTEDLEAADRDENMDALDKLVSETTGGITADFGVRNMALSKLNKLKRQTLQRALGEATLCLEKGSRCAEHITGLQRALGKTKTLKDTAKKKQKPTSDDTTLLKNWAEAKKLLKTLKAQLAPGAGNALNHRKRRYDSNSIGSTLRAARLRAPRWLRRVRRFLKTRAAAHVAGH